jgi:hypothetical protein
MDDDIANPKGGRRTNRRRRFMGKDGGSATHRRA